MLCFVQDKYVKEWLILAKWDGKKWVVLPGRIPYEIEDSRFHSALKHTYNGFRFYPESARQKLEKAKPIYISDETIDKIEAMLEKSAPLVPKRLDTREFFMSQVLPEERLTKKQLEEKRIADLKAKRDRLLAELRASKVTSDC
ncbi:hypothetical protein [Chroococcidiopsis sp.]|uniref:hypothetical protein n=1 Tax=Chroococcidiopsis sp. TaxID=3088168 RepID=UPI003F2E4BE3